MSFINSMKFINSNEQTWKICLSAVLDREVLAEYTLHISARASVSSLKQQQKRQQRQMASSQLSSSAEIGSTSMSQFTRHWPIHIKLLDVNDNAPRFEQSLISISVPENVEPNDEICQNIAPQLRAVDADEAGPNSQIRYKIVNTAAAKETAFHLDPITGQLDCFHALDRELKDHYRLVIEAQDAGVPSLSTKAIVEVSLCFVFLKTVRINYCF